MDDVRVPPETLYETLHPILQNGCEGLASQFSQALGIDIKSSPWNFIIDNRQIADLAKPFTLDANWPCFAQFFRGERDLLLFLEKPVMGIVNKPAKFWVFFDPKIAQAYFQRQTERPKDFSGQSIKKFPALELGKGLAKQLQGVLTESGIKVNQQIKKVEAFYTIADQFLPAEASQSFSTIAKKLIVRLALAEVKQLQLDITDAGSSPTLLEKRLQSIFRVCIRLYARRADGKEKESLKTLLSPKIIVRRKALELVGARLAADAT